MAAIGVDFGKRRIGLAVTDPNCRYALPWRVLAAKATLIQTADSLLETTRNRPCDLIVVGLPLDLRGADSPFTKTVRDFACMLALKAPLSKIVLWDERLTSVQGERALKELQLSRKERRGRTDLFAACAILQSYLDAQNGLSQADEVS